MRHLLLWTLLVSSVKALVPPKPLCSPKSHSSAKKWTMYFDDVSRHSMQWTPPASSVSYTPSSRVIKKNSTANDDEKAEAIQRMLLGYNAETASELDAEEIIQQMKLWATKSGVVGDFFGDELYEKMAGAHVCNATTVIQAKAQFWQSLVDVIESYSDDFSPLKWASTRRNQVHFLIFPNCPDLYSYKTMFTFVTAMEFSKELCLHLGNRLSLTLFHPKYKNSPKLFSPERHSPFPVVGLQFERYKPPKEAPAKPGKRQRGNAIFTEPVDEEEEIMAAGRIHDLNEQRASLEVLFNSAAVSGSDGEVLASIHDYHPPSSGSGKNLDDDDLLLTFQKEQQLRRRRLPAAKVKQISQAWAAENRFVDKRRQQKNNALQFIDSVADDRWIVSEHKVAEMVYADVWTAIAELYELGRQAEAKLEASPKIAEPTIEEERDGRSQGFNHFDFMKSLSRSFQPSGKKPSKPKSSRQPVVISSMFVATKFCAYNAQSFKRFAITINAALKRMTDGKMFLEVFHNEYTGQSGFNNSLRRSPFPMIQICYEVKSSGSE